LAVVKAVVREAGLVALRLSGPVAPELDEELDEDDDELLELLLLEEDELDELEDEDELLEDELELDEELELLEEELDELLEEELAAGVTPLAEIETEDVLPAASKAETT